MTKLPSIDFIIDDNKNPNPGVEHLEKSEIPIKVLVNKLKSITKTANKKIANRKYNEKYYNNNKAKILEHKSKICQVKKSLSKELEIFLNDMPENIVRSGTYNIKVKNKGYTLKLHRNALLDKKK